MMTTTTVNTRRLGFRMMYGAGAYTLLFDDWKGFFWYSSAQVRRDVLLMGSHHSTSLNTLAGIDYNPGTVR